MDDSGLFAILRQLAIVSAALSHDPANRDELLMTREALVQAAKHLGFAVSDEEQSRLDRRLNELSEFQEHRTTTHDHEEILAWAAEHDAVPAEVRRPVFDHQPSALRFLSGDAKKGTPELKPLSWEDFFLRFDLMGLAVRFDDELDDYEFIAVRKRDRSQYD